MSWVAAPPRPAGASAQLGALLRLRWQMTRAPGARLALGLAALAVLWLLVSALRSAGTLDPALVEVIVALAPDAYLGFGVLALVAPLTAGGGEVVPPEQLVAVPVRAQAQFLGGVLLAPLNLVWLLQLLVLAVVTSCLTAAGGLLTGALTTLLFVGLVTVLGQALAWAFVGLRQTRRGRRAALAAGVTGGVGLLLAVRTGAGLDPAVGASTSAVVRTVVAGGAGELGRWAAGTAALAGAVAGGLLLGLRCASWALRRPGGTAGAGAGRAVRRRRVRRSVLGELVALDRASVWRAPALRRGALALALLPGLLVAGTQTPWASLAVLPGLVAAGTALLFGVNAFALDGPGSTWLASLPLDPGLLVRAKLLVLTETVLGGVVLVSVTGALAAPAPPTSAELAAVVTSALVGTVLVVSVALALSVRFPHRADLRGPRDAIAPPGALALASVALALPSVLVGGLLGAGGASGRAWLPPLLALPVLLLSGLGLRRTLRRWQDAGTRARVRQAVARG